MSSVLLLNGPNLNMLGRREPDIYGYTTLEDIVDGLEALADEYAIRLQHLQSNSEAELIERVHLAMDDGTDFIIINPAAFTHTSVALRDALAMVKVPFVEVHLSNVYTREEFRKHSYFSDLAVGVIAGLGAEGYRFALEAAVTYMES